MIDDDDIIYMKSYISFIPDTPNNKSLYSKNYNNKTLGYYKTLRKNKINVMDPSNENLLFDPEKSFKYKYIWNSITGESIDEKDPYGALYFFPDDLINYFYCRRLYGLWNDDDGYGVYVGAGSTLSFNKNFDKSQDYLFRLPITDCYLPDNYNSATITMGPKLSLDKIKKIYKLATTYYKNNYINKYGRPRPDLIVMYKYYINAITEIPELNCDTDISKVDDIKKIYYQQNMDYVDKLKEL